MGTDRRAAVDPFGSSSASPFPTLRGRADPQSIFDEAVRLAASLAGSRSRAMYLVIRGGVASVIAEFDPTGRHAPPFIWIEQHNPLATVVATGGPLSVHFSASKLAPSVRSALDRLGVTDGAAVPVNAWGALHGVLAVGSRDGEIRGASSLVELAQAIEEALDPFASPPHRSSGTRTADPSRPG